MEYRQRYKDAFDVNVKPHDLKLGQLVLCRRQDRVHNKYCAAWYGPYIILGLDDNNKVVFIQDIKSKKTRYVNAEKLKRYCPRGPTMFTDSKCMDAPRMSEKDKGSDERQRYKKLDGKSLDQQYQEVEESLNKSESTQEITILNPWVHPTPKIIAKTEQTGTETDEVPEQASLPRSSPGSHNYGPGLEEFRTPQGEFDFVRREFSYQQSPEPLPYSRGNDDVDEDFTNPDYITVGETESITRRTQPESGARSKDTVKTGGSLFRQVQKTLDTLTPDQTAVRAFTRPLITNPVRSTRSSNPNVEVDLHLPKVALERKPYTRKK
jgi:hypothetical protein